eukprot:171103-Prorocentrum_minimum.AAC.3
MFFTSLAAASGLFLRKCPRRDSTVVGLTLWGVTTSPAPSGRRRKRGSRSPYTIPSEWLTLKSSQPLLRGPGGRGSFAEEDLTRSPHRESEWVVGLLRIVPPPASARACECDCDCDCDCDCVLPGSSAGGKAKRGKRTQQNMQRSQYGGAQNEGRVNIGRCECATNTPGDGRRQGDAPGNFTTEATKMHHGDF